MKIIKQASEADRELHTSTIQKCIARRLSHCSLKTEFVTVPDSYSRPFQPVLLHRVRHHLLGDEVNDDYILRRPPRNVFVRPLYPRVVVQGFSVHRLSPREFMRCKVDGCFGHVPSHHLNDRLESVTSSLTK